MTRFCAECGQHPAIYRMTKTGQVTARKDHDLCQRCVRAAHPILEQAMAMALEGCKDRGEALEALAAYFVTGCQSAYEEYLKREGVA